jgi:hypothetical protein
MKSMKALVFVSLLIASAVAVYAAECREGKIVLNGATCTVTDAGHCSCSD